MRGKLLTSIRDVTESDSRYFSHFQCRCEEEVKCHHYVFDTQGICFLYETCDYTSDCPTCIKGDKECWLDLGGDCYLSPTTAATSSPETTTDCGNDKGTSSKSITNY